MSHDDFEEPNFIEDTFDEDNAHEDNHVEHNNDEDEDDNKQEKSKNKSKPDLKKFALPAVILLIVGGLIAEGGKIKQMVMGTSSNTPISSPHPIHSNNTLSKPSLNTPSNPNVPAIQTPTLGSTQPDLSPPTLPITAPKLPSNTPALNIPPVIGNNNADIPGLQTQGLNKPEPELVHPSPLPQPINDLDGHKVKSLDTASDNHSSSNFTDVLSVLHDNGQKIDDAKKDITTSIQDSASNVNSHIDNRTKDIEDKIDILTQKTNAVSDKLDAISKNPTALNNTKANNDVAPSTSLGHHKVKAVTHKKKAIKKVEKPKVVEETGMLTDYHLLGVSKKTVLLQGPNGKYLKVNMGETPSGSAGETIGTVEGVVNAGGNNWYLRTSKGKITE